MERDPFRNLGIVRERADHRTRRQWHIRDRRIQIAMHHAEHMRVRTDETVAMQERDAPGVGFQCVRCERVCGSIVTRHTPLGGDPRQHRFFECRVIVGARVELERRGHAGIAPRKAKEPSIVGPEADIRGRIEGVAAKHLPSHITDMPLARPPRVSIRCGDEIEEGLHIGRCREWP